MTLDQPTINALAVAIADRVAAQLGEWQTRRFFTVKQAATYAGLSEKSIRNLLAAGELTALRPVRGRILIDRRQLDAVILASNYRPRKGRGMRRRVESER